MIFGTLERKSPAEDTWLDHCDLHQIYLDMLEYYKSFFTPDLTESSPISPEENNEDMVLTRSKRMYYHV